MHMDICPFSLSQWLLSSQLSVNIVLLHSTSKLHHTQKFLIAELQFSGYVWSAWFCSFLSFSEECPKWVALPHVALLFFQRESLIAFLRSWFQVDFLIIALGIFFSTSHCDLSVFYQTLLLPVLLAAVTMFTVTGRSTAVMLFPQHGRLVRIATVGAIWAVTGGPSGLSWRSESRTDMCLLGFSFFFLRIWCNT